MEDLVLYEGGALAVADPPGRAVVPANDPSGQALVPATDHPGASLVTPGALPPRPPRPRRPRRWSRAAALAVVAAVVVGATAGALVVRGGSGRRSAAPAAAGGGLAGPARASASARSAAFTLSITTAGPGTTSTLVAGHGSIDLASGVEQLTASVPTAASILGATTGSVTLVSDRHNVYVRVPALSVVTGHRSWVEFPTTGGASAGSSALSALADPSGLLGVLRSVGAVTRVGTPTIDGAPTTEYRATVSVVDLVDAIDHAGRGSSASRTAADVAAGLGAPTVPLTAWVGTDGMVHRMSVSLDLNAPDLSGLLGPLGLAATGSPAPLSQVTVVLGLSRYGKPVVATVPPPSESVNLGGAYHSLRNAVSTLGSDVSGALRGI